MECALKLELEIIRYNRPGKTYFDKARSLIYNIQDEKNSQVRKALLYQQVKPSEFLKTDMK